MDNAINDKWVGIEEAAQYMDVTKDTVRNWIKKNRYSCPQDRKTMEV